MSDVNSTPTPEQRQAIEQCLARGGIVSLVHRLERDHHPTFFVDRFGQIGYREVDE